MFERYTEKARRAVFLARYEASEFGSPEIDSEHLPWGLLLGENKPLRPWIPNAPPETIRKWIDAQTTRNPSFSSSIDLPLGHSVRKTSKVVLDEADRRAHRPIGTEH